MLMAPKIKILTLVLLSPDLPIFENTEAIGSGSIHTVFHSDRKKHILTIECCRMIGKSNWEECCVLKYSAGQFFKGSKITPERQQSKTLLKIDECGSKIARNCFYYCHLSPVRRQIAIENSVSNYFDLRLSIVFTFSIAAYPV